MFQRADGTRLPPYTRTPHRWQSECHAAAVPKLLAALSTAAPCRLLVHAATGSGKSVCQALILRSVLEAVPAARVCVTVPSVNLVEQLLSDMKAALGPDRVGVWFGRRKEPAQITIVCMPSFSAFLADRVSKGLTFDLLMADEAHKTEADRFKEAMGDNTFRAVIGFTATPFRSGDERLSLFSELLYSYPYAQALQDGVLVPLRWVSWGDREDGDPVEPPAGLNEEEAAAMVARLGADARTVQLIRENPVFPMVCGAADTEHADHLAHRLRAEGWRVAVIHSKLSETDDHIPALKRGDLDILVHVAMLAEGVDMPWLRAVVLRHFKASVRIEQTIGRVARVDRERPGSKLEGLVIDPENLFATTRLRNAAIGVDPGEELIITKTVPPHILHDVPTLVRVHGPNMLGVSVQVEGQPIEPEESGRKTLGVRLHKELPEGVDHVDLPVFLQRGDQFKTITVQVLRRLPDKKEHESAVRTGQLFAAGQVALWLAWLCRSGQQAGLIPPVDSAYPRGWVTALAPLEETVKTYALAIDMLRRRAVIGRHGDALLRVIEGSGVQVKTAQMDLHLLMDALSKGDPWEPPPGGEGYIPTLGQIVQASHLRLNPETDRPYDLHMKADAMLIRQRHKAELQAGREARARNNSPDCPHMFISLIWVAAAEHYTPQMAYAIVYQGRVLKESHRQLIGSGRDARVVGADGVERDRNMAAAELVQYARRNRPDSLNCLVKVSQLFPGRSSFPWMTTIPDEENPAEAVAKARIDWRPPR